MTTKSISLAAIVFVLSSSLSVSVQAAVIESSSVTIGGLSYETFYDTNSSLQWLDLDNFWDGTTTYNSLTSTLNGSGFHLATESELTALQTSIGLPFNFTEVATIIGGNYSNNPDIVRDLIWGIYEDGDSSNGVSFSYKYLGEASWSYVENLYTATQTLYSANPDLGAWVVADSVSIVPVPAAVWLFGSGLIGLIGFARRKKL